MSRKEMRVVIRRREGNVFLYLLQQEEGYVWMTLEGEATGWRNTKEALQIAREYGGHIDQSHKWSHPAKETYPCEDW